MGGKKSRIVLRRVGIDGNCGIGDGGSIGERRIDDGDGIGDGDGIADGDGNGDGDHSNGVEEGKDIGGGDGKVN